MRTAATTLRLAAIALVLGVSLPQPLTAQAQPGGFRGQGGGAGFQRERHPRQFQPPRQADDGGRQSWRDQRSGDGGAANGGDGRPERLSPEERRQLRRDIRDAGQDVYRPGHFRRY
ncbi:MAG: hypothetical protein EG825_08520 [Rhodocyclaceae bacterium]|nr:hypothetical protein [Rhodocyclaceae bacterium]